CALRYRRRDATSRKAVSCRAPIGIERAHQKVGHFHSPRRSCPLVDAAERQAPVDHALIVGSTLVAGFTLLSRFAPVPVSFICAVDFRFAADRVSDLLPPHATL